MKYMLRDMKDDQYLKGEIKWEHFHQDSSMSPDTSMTNKLFFKKSNKTGNHDGVTGAINK